MTFDYLATLVAQKRARPGDDLISALCESGHPDEFVAGLVSFVSISYLVTPSNLSSPPAISAPASRCSRPTPISATRWSGSRSLCRRQWRR